MKILSIPYKNKDFTIKQTEMFDYYEIRADYAKNLKNFPLQILNLKTILTVRDKNCGGINKFSEKDKVILYKSALNTGSLVDCELEFYKKHTFLQNEKNIILSHHNFTQHIDFKKVNEILGYHKKVKFVKIAAVIDSYKVLQKLSDKIKHYPNVILVSMGKTGLVSRLLYKKFNSVATYIGLDNFKTAPNQLTVSSLFFDISNVNKKTMIGGIVGGEQIIHSNGLIFYNDYFKRHNLNAVYVPFLTEDLKDFTEWFLKQNFYGLSITMPFKEKFSQLIKNKKESNNLFTRDKKLYNTDKIALEKAKTELGIKSRDKVLVYGSGAMAKLALEVFDNSDIYVAFRNRKKADSVFFGYKEKTIPQDIDLLINCTPLGLNENFFEKSGLKIIPRKIIDLPYNPKKETFLITFAKENNLPFVDGLTFWHWQANRQLEEFEKAIKDNKNSE